MTKTRSPKKKYYDKSAKGLTILQQNQVVRIESEKRFDKLGTIIGTAQRLRSYVIESDG